MSAVSKGKRFENFVAEQLEDMGYHIAFKSMRVKFRAIDFDGAWDLVAIKRLDDDPFKLKLQVRWVFVQCKSRKLYGKEKEALVNWKKTWGFKGIVCLLAIKKKVKGRVTIVWEEI